MEMEKEMRATQLLTPRLRYIRPSAWGSRMAGEGPREEGLRIARGRAGWAPWGCPSSFLGQIVTYQHSPPLFERRKVGTREALCGNQSDRNCWHFS